MKESNLKTKINTLSNCIELVKRLDKWEAVEAMSEDMFQLIDDLDNEIYNRDRR